MSSNNASGTCSAGDGGGILRDGRRKGIMYLSEDDDDNNDRNSHPRHKGVSFGQTTTSTIPSHTAEGEGEGEGEGGGGGGYDSDDLYDASAVTGSLPAATSAGAGGGGGGGGGGELDEVSRQQAGVEQARRQRREAKNQTEGELAERADEIDQIEKDDGHSNGSTSSKGGGGSRQHFRGEEDLDRNLSLIDTRRSAESNTATGAYDAGDNAECPVEPFNMKAEREGGEGYFDGDTYVFRRGEGDDGEPDAWLDELATGGSGSGSGPGAAAGGGDNSASSNAAEASIARITGQGRSSKGAAKKAPALDLEGLTDAELCRRIAALLASDDETVARALKRYGDVIARHRKRKQKAAKAATRAKKQAGDNGMQQVEVADEVGDDDDQGVQAAQKALSELTELADALLMSGDGEVYGRKRSELVTKSSVGNADDDHVAGQKRKRGYFGEEKDDVPTNKAAKAEESSTAASSKKEAVQWEYKGNQDNQIHGPYTTEQMLGWIQAGYFVGEAAVDVRKVKSASEEAATSPPAAAAATTDDLMADLMDSDDEDNGNSKEAAATAADAQEEWERSDKIDFSVYLR